MLKRTPTTPLFIQSFYEVTKRITLADRYRRLRQDLGADVRAILQYEEARERPDVLALNLPFVGSVVVDYSTSLMPRIIRGRIGAVTHPVPVPGDTLALADSDTLLQSIRVC